MRRSWILELFCLLALPLLNLACATAPNQQDAERYIVDCERQWAESVTTGDTTDIERFLADDFIGVDTEGRHYTKQQAILEIRDAPKDFVSNHLNQVKVRFYGNSAVAQGDESWLRRTGDHRRGRFVWTDTWILRNGRWQIVAAEDLIVLEPTP
jgi:hypothetical protein